MKEQEIMLKSYRKEIEVLVLEMEIPQYDLDDERAKFFPRYEDVLLKLFNNKRDNNEILKIQNYYGSNAICIHINLTEYIKGNGKTKEENIEFLKNWFRGGLDISLDKIDVRFYKGYIYTIPEYENNISGFDRETNEWTPRYLEWEDFQ